MLFSVDFYTTGEEAKAQMEQYFQSPEEDDTASDGTLQVVHKVDIGEKDQEYLRERTSRIVDLVEEIDKKIDEVAAGWKTKRMGKVELAILRLAVYEMLYDDTIPEKVSVNEAVELAKKFGGNESPAFVNGVLAKFIPKEGAKEEAVEAKEEIKAKKKQKKTKETVKEEKKSRNNRMGSVYTVSQVTSYIKNMFTQDFALNRISIKGEVSNCKYHTSGHIYFTLKDGGAQIAAVMFAGQAKSLDFHLTEGQEVVVSGTVDVYERDGRYQLYAKEIKREGRGDLIPAL